MKAFRASIEKLLAPLPHQLKVEFALFCAKDANPSPSKESKHCIELVEKWLVNPASVSDQELYTASSAAAFASASAASAAAYASSAASSASASASSAYAASAYASSAASYASASYAVYAAVNQDKLNEYETYLKDMINNLTKLEKIFYNLEKEF